MTHNLKQHLNERKVMKKLLGLFAVKAGWGSTVTGVTMCPNCFGCFETWGPLT